MSYKNREALKNNLLQIRKDLGYTQKQMGEVLDVGIRMVCNYETGKHDFPIDKAFILVKEYNYSLNYIYCLEDSSNEISLYNTPTPNKEYLVDIREFFSRSKDTIQINIPEYCWKYISHLNSIKSSCNSNDEKKRTIAKINANYKKAKDSDGIYRRFEFPKNQFFTCYRFDDDFISYGFIDSEDKMGGEFVPTNEQQEEASTFFNNLLNYK